MAGLGDAGRVVGEIAAARADLVKATSGDGPNHPKGKTPPWLITEFGDSCNQVDVLEPVPVLGVNHLDCITRAVYFLWGGVFNTALCTKAKTRAW